MPRPTEKCRARLMVEGSDDKWAVIGLLERHGVNWDQPTRHLPYVHACEGVTKLLQAVGPAVRSFDRLGIVLDADDRVDPRWRQVCDRLHAEGIILPRGPTPEGVAIDTGEGKRVGVWLMPDNHSPGKLDDFLASLVPVDDPTWPHARESTVTARSLGAPLAEADLPKGVLHAWLAWQAQPGAPFGTALKSGVLCHDVPLATAFVAWFQRMFIDP